MQFKNPEILYFLFALILPILVHLFQLKKFKKIAFTNVAFLKEIKLQTRKSSQLKKWLILLTRMLLFTVLIFAFAQPYFSAQQANQKQHYFIYLDNSLSTSAKGAKGNLLQVAIQEIIENSNEKDSYSLLTNTDYYADITASNLKNKLLNTTYSGKSSNFNEVFLRFNTSKKNKTNTLNELILISDFQLYRNLKINEFTNVTPPFSAVSLVSETKNNLSIDSIFITNPTTTDFTLNVVVNNQGDAKENIPVSLFNDTKLVGKRSFSIEKNKTITIDFAVQKSAVFLGKIELNYNDTFSFDNSFYFTENSTQKTNVLSIGKSTKFLPKIYTKNEFNFTQNTLKNIDYNALKNQQLIILNELKEIPKTLATQLIDFCNNDGHLVIIPNENSNIYEYNSFLSNFTSGKITNLAQKDLKITRINYDHPLFSNVFSKQVTNFQYPLVKSSYPNNLKGSDIINFENQTAFVKAISSKNNNIYWFSSALNIENSNFQNSPLIVPVFYNIGLESLKTNTNYYTIDQLNEIDVPVSLKKDAVLNLQNKLQNSIPLQQQYQNKVTLSVKDEILNAGFYNITNKLDTLKTVAFNYPKKESLLAFMDLTSMANENNKLTIYDSAASLFNHFDEKNEVQWFWKWFLALAIVSLLLEILILKFFKT